MESRGLKVRRLASLVLVSFRCLAISMSQQCKPASFLEEPPRDMPAEKKAYHLKRRELVKRFLSSVSLLILEEAHESSGSNFYDIAALH